MMTQPVEVRVDEGTLREVGEGRWQELVSDDSECEMYAVQLYIDGVAEENSMLQRQAHERMFVHETLVDILLDIVHLQKAMSSAGAGCSCEWFCRQQGKQLGVENRLAALSSTVSAMVDAIHGSGGSDEQAAMTVDRLGQVRQVVLTSKELVSHVKDRSGVPDGVEVRAFMERLPLPLLFGRKGSQGDVVASDSESERESAWDETADSGVDWQQAECADDKHE